jgi:cytochrome d ubiquinol oxidase subunit I
MFNENGVSPSNGVGVVLLTLVGFTIVYGILAIVEAGLLLRRISRGLPSADPLAGVHHDSEPALAFEY